MFHNKCSDSESAKQTKNVALWNCDGMIQIIQVLDRIHSWPMDYDFCDSFIWDTFVVKGREVGPTVSDTPKQRNMIQKDHIPLFPVKCSEVSLFVNRKFTPGWDLRIVRAFKHVSRLIGPAVITSHTRFVLTL